MPQNYEQQAIDWQVQFISPYKHGYFITLNTNIYEDRLKIYSHTFDQFETNLRSIVHALNVFCLGRSYLRNENQLHTLVSMEIGKENSRLHAHLFALHKGECKRSSIEVFDRLRTKIVRSYGLPTTRSAIEVSDFVPILGATTGTKYFHKSSEHLMRRYGVTNCFIV